MCQDNQGYYEVDGSMAYDAKRAFFLVEGKVRLGVGHRSQR